jgi:GT2 family glycosyltransferase
MKLSIVIVSWNAKQMVLDCLESVIRSMPIGTEIILVDNASSDGTPQEVEKHFPLVRLIKNESNLGFAKGNNIGISAANGEYLALINSDVIVPPECLDKLVAYMNEHQDIGLLGPQMRDPNGNVCRSTMRAPSLWRSFCDAACLNYLLPRFRHECSADVEVLNGWFWVVRRSAIEQAGLLDEKFFMYGEDLDWSKRFHNARWRVVFFADAHAIHLGAGSSRQSPIHFYIEMHKALLRFWRAYHSKAAVAAYLAVTYFHQILRVVGYTLLFLLRGGTGADAAFKVCRSLACMGWLIHHDLESHQPSRSKTEQQVDANQLA